MFFAGARGNHDDRHVLQAAVVAHVGGNFEAVHTWHLDIQQHHIRADIFQFGDGIHAVLGGDHFVAVALQQASGHLAHGNRVIGDHDQWRIALEFGFFVFWHRFLGQYRNVCDTQGRHLHVGGTDQRVDIENDHHGAIPEDGGAADAGHRCQLRTYRFHYHFPGTHQVVHHNGHGVFGAADQQYRHGGGVVFQVRAAGAMDEIAQVLQFVILAHIGVDRVVFLEIVLQLEGADTHDAFDLVERDGVGIFRRFHHQRPVHGQGKRQADDEAGALPLVGIDGHRAAHLLDLAGHHVHAHATAGNLRDSGGGGEAGMEDELLDFLFGELRVRGDQAAFHGFLAHCVGVDALAVVGQGNHYLATFAAQLQVDAPGVVLAGALATFTGFDAVIHGVTQHVLQGRHHPFHQGAVKFAFRVEHIEIHPFVHFTGNLPDDTAQTWYQAAEGHHAGAHQFFL